jgi:hypothetical protein
MARAPDLTFRIIDPLGVVDTIAALENIRDNAAERVIALRGSLALTVYSLSIDTLADVLTERHIAADGFCGESHMADAEDIVRRYAARADDRRSPA